MKEWDDLILKDLNPDNPKFRYDLKDFIFIESAIGTLSIELKDSLFEKVLELQKEEEVCCFIRNFQVHLIYLSDSITYYKAKINNTPENELTLKYSRLLEQASDLVTSMLYFLSTYFSTYFDKEKEVPFAEKEKSKKYFASKISDINQLGDYKHDRLLQTVLLPAFEFQNDDPEKIATFGKIIYLDVLLNEVITILKTEEDAEEALKWKLIYLNFNSLLFFCHVQKEMKETIRRKGTDSAKIRVLNWYLKQIKQSGAKPGFALDPNGRNVQDRLSEWIKEEISFIEKYPTAKDDVSTRELLLSSKSKLDLSVPQLGALIDLMIKLGVGQEKERRIIARGYSMIHQTKQAATISENSLYNKSKEIERSTLISIRELLLKGVSIIDEAL